MSKNKNDKNKAAKAKEVAQAVQAAGNKVTKSDVKAMQEQGLGNKQIQAVAQQVGNVGNKAAAVIDKSPQQKAASAKQVAQAVKQAGNTLNKGDVRQLQGNGLSASDISRVGQQIVASGGRIGQGGQQALTNAQAKQAMAAGPQGRPSIKAGLDMVGTKLSKNKVSGLSRMGFTNNQLNKIAGRVETVGDKARARLDRAKAKTTGGPGVPSTSFNPQESRQQLLDRFDAVEQSSNPAYDWLQAEISAIQGGSADSGSGSTTPSLFNSYQGWQGFGGNSSSGAEQFTADSQERWRQSSGNSGTQSGDTGNAGFWAAAVDNAAASWRSTPEGEPMDQRQVVPESTAGALLYGGPYGSGDEEIKEGWKRWFG